MTGKTALIRFGFILFACMVFVSPSFAQGDGYLTNSNLRGEVPFGSYQYGEIDNINLGNGAVNLRFTLWKREGRGLDNWQEVSYSSKIWTFKPTYQPCNPETDPFGCQFVPLNSLLARVTMSPEVKISGPYWGELTWTEDYITCYSGSTQWDMKIRYNFTYLSADGGSTRFPNRDFFTYPPGITIPCYDGFNPYKYTKGQSDSGVMELDTSQEPYVIRHKDGTITKFTIGNEGVVTTSVTDRNGNQITFGAGGADTIGRQGLRDSAGNPAGYGTTYGSAPINPPFPAQMCGKPLYHYDTSVSVLQSLSLPDGQSFVFEYYSDYGELKKVTLPTGGYIRYEYTLIPDFDNLPEDLLVACAGFHSRRVTKRCKSADGTVGSEKCWSYSYSRNPSNGEYTTTVTDPDLNVAVHRFDVDGIHELETTAYQGASTPLRKSVIGWNQTWGVLTTNQKGETTLGGKDFRVVSRTNYMLDVNPNLVSKTETVYGANYVIPVFGYGNVSENRVNVVETKEYDYGSGVVGALKRRTTFSYLHDSNSNYLNRHIWDRVTWKMVYDGGSNLVAKTETRYDTLPLASTAQAAVQHDYTNFGPGFPYRGNPTETKVWRNTDGAWLTSKSWFDDLGNVVQTQDPLGHNAFFDYTDSWAQSTCAPVGGSALAFVKTTTNHLGHTVTNTYFSCTGFVASSTDPNAQTTSFQYDSMDRLTQVNRPDGGWTTHAFDDVNRKVTRNVALDATRTLSAEFVYDGLWRVTDTAFLSDPEGITRSEVIYDAFGRVTRAYNPTRCPTVTVNCGESTWGYTDMVYDALGRATTLISPSGGSVTTAYSGNATTVTDQSGKQRRSLADALGRLIQVDEPNPTLATPAVTSYTYDALDNLLAVVQSGSRQRYFAYNSLSQLTQAINPESGTINYTYDNDGNVVTKTDARGVVTTYAYDALHRLTQKTYSDGTGMAQYFYDESNPWGWPLPNTRGRMSRQITWQGSNVITGSQFGYDEMGRVVHLGQCTPSTCGWGGFDPQADYDLAGNLLWLTYPSGRKVTYDHNTAGRLTRVTFDSWNGQAVNYDYLSSASYGPHGAPTSMTLGNGLTETMSYNNRVQPNQIRVASGILTAMDVTYNFYDAQGKNNGNVMAINDQLNAGRIQTFTYDQLNRLKTAQSQATSGSDCWGLNFNYDIWANLYSSGVTKCSAPTLGLTINAQNRIIDTGFQYDAAGNLTADGSYTYQYDAENRMKSLNATGATYTYDAEGNRARKQVGSESTEYIYFGGQVIAERNTAGEWSDYIFAGGRRLARADTYEDRIRTYGTYCSGCGWQWSIFWFPNAAGLNGYVIQSDDKLYLRQYQSTGARGGPGIWFTDGSYTGNVTYDQDGQLSNADTFQNVWHYRRIDLSSQVGKTVSGVGLITEGLTQAGSWNIYYQDIVLISADGTVRPLYNRQRIFTLTVSGSPESTRGYEVNHIAPAGQWPDATTAYYHGDHLGSSRLTSSENGYPVWSATYLPFGQERNPQITVNTYKFTGKERDSESSLDYFGARYYSSGYGRFTSPDLPFADQEKEDPQSWNLYSYVTNNPLGYKDPTGRGKARAISRGLKKGLSYLRRKAVREAWKQERQLLRKTGKATANFTDKGERELLKTGKVKGWQGHHINSVKGHPELAKNPDNIKFVKGAAENLKEHGGNFQNETTGELIERSKLMGGLTGLATFLEGVDAKAEMVAEEVPIASDADSWHSWINPVNDLIELGALAHSLYTTLTTDNLDGGPTSDLGPKDKPVAEEKKKE